MQPLPLNLLLPSFPHCFSPLSSYYPTAISASLVLLLSPPSLLTEALIRKIALQIPPRLETVGIVVTGSASGTVKEVLGDLPALSLYFLELRGAIEAWLASHMNESAYGRARGVELHR